MKKLTLIFTIIALLLLCSVSVIALTTFSTNSITSVSTSPLSNITFVVAYCDDTANIIAFKIYNTNGTNTTGEITVDATAGACVDDAVSVSSFNNTDFVIGWSDITDDDTTFAIYNTNGILKSGPTDVDTGSTGGTTQSVSVSTFNSTNFVIGWADRYTGNTFATYNYLSTLIYGPKKIATYITTGVITVAAMNSTTFGMGEYENGDFSYGVYDYNGSVITGPTAENSLSTSGKMCSAGLNSTNYIWAYVEEGNNDLYVRGYNYLGTEITTITLADLGTLTEAISIAPINSTDFILFYHDDNNDNINFTHYNSAGSLIVTKKIATLSSTSLSVASYQPTSGISFCNNNFIIAYVNSTTSALWDTYNANGTAWDGTCYVNSPPVFTQSPTSFSLHHNTNLSVQLNATDADGNTIYWGINTSLITINTSGYMSDDPLQSEQGNYSIRVNITDNTSVTNLVFNYEIINSPPTIASATITPDPAADANDLTCNNGSVSDPELDTLTFYYYWYKNSTLTGNNTQILGNGNTTTNDQWYCKINVSDGLFYSGAVQSQTVTIGASAVTPSLNYTNATTQGTQLTSNTANPTKNNTLVNLSITFFDPNTNDRWTAYFCKTNVFDGTTCTGGQFCSSAINSSSNPLTCTYNPASETSSSAISYYVYVKDNSTLVQGSGSGKAGTFTINHPPTKPVLTPANMSWVNKNYTSLSPTSTDPDNDTIYYHLFMNSTAVNTTVSTFNITNLNETYYYWYAVANDTHGYESSASLTAIFRVDYTPPTILGQSLSASPYYTGSSVTAYVNCTDSNSGADISKVVLNVSDSIVSVRTRELYLAQLLADLFSVDIPTYSSGLAGLYTIDMFTCMDNAGNYNNLTGGLSFTTTIAPTGSPGGGGSTTIIITPSGNTTLNYCGDGVCNSYLKNNATFTENPGNCLSDCKVNFDNLLTCWFKDPKTCITSEAWFVNLLVFVIFAGLVVLFLLDNQKKRKQVKHSE
jgi:hypothetical protein